MSKEAIMGGPEFELRTNRFVIGLGYMEYPETGILLAQILDERYNPHAVDIVTINGKHSRLATDSIANVGIRGRHALAKEMANSTVVMHSAFPMRGFPADQIIGFNTAEGGEYGVLEMAVRGQQVAKDEILIEDGAHIIGSASDQRKANFELVKGVIKGTTFSVPWRLWRGYSAVDDLIARKRNIPNGIALIHSDGSDVHGFDQIADLDAANASGITTAVVPGLKHNEVLVAPAGTLDRLPAIFPPAE